MPRIRFTATPKLPRDLKHLGYEKGMEVDLPDDQVNRWLRRGVADVIADAKPAGRTKSSKAAELLGVKGAPEVVAVRGKDVPMTDVIAAAFKRSTLTVEAWNALTEADRERKLVDEVEELNKAAPAA